MGQGNAVIWLPQAFLDQVVVPALVAIGEYSLPRALLVLATCMAESGLRATVQKGGGPAKGYSQMETATHEWLWSSFLGTTAREHILAGLRTLSPVAGHDAALIESPQYACAMCAVKYLSVKAPLPCMQDPETAAAYYVKYYNGGGKATVERVLPFFRTVSTMNPQPANQGV